MFNKTKTDFKHLQKIVLNDPYTEAKECMINMIDDYYDPEDTILYCEDVNFVVSEFFIDEMNEYGMDKAVNTITIALCLIEHNDLDAVWLYDAYCDILDLETGKYDDLFTKKDLKLLKDDIIILKKFFENHPEFTDSKHIPEDYRTWLYNENT